ncbi:MAG: hypothetical protein CML04_02050 [Pseudozobellia sp.]|nr:hypothetical protein [Pseudozobellia sp.]MBG48965.1 hypothetical protein [Pseudozobellia sp.]|tara:strand:+ start:85 stop:435 length:351 start_codon:yes stop_codon:yes gene_type:complete
MQSNKTTYYNPIELSEYQQLSRPLISSKESCCFYIKVHGYLLLAEYVYDYFNFPTYPVCHFTFRGETASETGYRSHFVMPANIDNVIDYAIEAARHLYQELKRKHPQKVSGQYSLF